MHLTRKQNSILSSRYLRWPFTTIAILLIWKSTFGMALSVVPELKSVNDEDTKSSEVRVENHPGTTTGTTTTSSSTTKQQHSNPEPCSWGELCHSSSSTTTTTTGTNRTQTLIPEKLQAREKTTITNSKDEPHTGGRIFDITSEGNNNKDPYSTKSHEEQQQQHHYPPAGYSVDARVYVHPHNSLAYFDRTLLPTLPYWDCASTGITTPPLPLQHAVIRYSLSASSSQTTSSSSTNSSPLSSSSSTVCLLIPLQQKPITLELSSGESKILLPGSVVWLDSNVPSSSYRFVSNHEEHMTILSLTLPRHTPLHPPVLMKGSGTSAAAASSSSSWPFFNTHSKNMMQGGDNEGASQCWMFIENEPSWRRRGITIVGVAMSILIADWMGRVAPIWLSLGIGGGCWVIGGTWGFVQVMEPLLDRLERKFRIWYQTIPQTLHSNENEEDDMNVQQHPTDNAAEEESTEV